MKKIVLLMLLLGSLTYAENDDFKVGGVAITNSYSYMSMYKFGMTASYETFRFDANSYRADLYYTWFEYSIKSFTFYAQGGTGTFYLAPDIWMLRFPMGVNYAFTQHIESFVEVSADYPLFTSGFVLANPGLTNTIKLGLVYRF